MNSSTILQDFPNVFDGENFLRQDSKRRIVKDVTGGFEASYRMDWLEPFLCKSTDMQELPFCIV